MYIIRPIITEKSLGLAKDGWYTFAVAKQANKEQIAREVETMYHVNVLTVRTVSVHGKVRRRGKKMISTRMSDTKKAIAQVKKGQQIDAFEITKEPEAEEKKPAAAKAKAGK